MIYRKLTESGDYMLGRRNQFHEDQEAVAQAVKTRLQHLLGEWWENTEDGLPLFQEILASFHATDYRAEMVDLIFSERILGTEGVAEILSFESDINAQTRTYSAHCRIQTVYGETFDLQIAGNGPGPLTITV